MNIDGDIYLRFSKTMGNLGKLENLYVFILQFLVCTLERNNNMVVSQPV